MNQRLFGRVFALAAIAGTVGMAGACGHPPHPGPPPGTSPGTIPIDGWAIAGTTVNQFCGGPTPVGGCTAPFRPASDRVSVARDGAVVATAVSGADGAFRIGVGPGTYVVTALTTTMGARGSCESKTVTVGGPPVPRDIGELHCTVQAP
jgi:hypothetical protein